MPRFFCLSIPQTSIKVNIVMVTSRAIGFLGTCSILRLVGVATVCSAARRQIAVLRTLSLSAIWTRNAEVGTKTMLNLLCLTVDIVSP